MGNPGCGQGLMPHASLATLTARLKPSAGTRRVILCVGTMSLALSGIGQAHAQFQRWYDLSEQAQQLKNQGNDAAALPVEQQAEKVAEATWGPEDQHAALSLNVLGVLNMDLEKFRDAETNLNRALAVFTKLEGAQGKNVATVEDNLGNLYRQTANYPVAEKATRQALAIHERLLGENNDDVSTDASNLALIYVDENRYPEAELLYKRAVAIDQRLGGAANLSTDLGGLGNLYSIMHKYADAERAFGQALTLDVKALGQQHPKIGLDLYHLALAEQLEGKFADAEQTYAKAMAVEEKAPSPELATVAVIDQNVGGLFRDEGKYPQAEALLMRALVNRVKALGPNHPDVASILEDLGKLYAFETRYSDADRALQQALTVDMKSLGQQNLQTAHAMVNLAELHGEHGDYGTADQFFYKAIPVYAKVLGQNDERVANLLFNAASNLLAEQKPEEARKGFGAAAAIYQKVDGESSRGYARCLDSLAAIAESGRGHDLAEKLHKQALAIYENLDGPDSLDVSDCLEGLARIYKDEQKFSDAEPLNQRQLKIEQAHSGPNNPRVGDAEADLAALYYAWGKPAQAQPYFQMYLKNLMDQFRANAATMSERDRLIFFATFRNAFPLFFSFVLKFHGQVPELTGKMYDALLEEKGLIASSAASMRAAVEASGDPQAVQMLDNLASDKAQVAALTESPVGDPANFRAQLNKVAIEANTLEGELLKRSAAMSRQKAQNAVTWQDVQRALKPGEAAVEVVRFQLNTGITPTADMVYVALVVTPDSKQPLLVALGLAEDLEAAPMMAYRDNVGRTRGFEQEETPGTPGHQGNVANTSAAYAAFWKPLEPALGAVKRVYVSPNGVLDTIPMGLMADSNGKLLMEKIQLRIVNSTKDLLLPPQVVAKKSALLVGNPKFDLTAAEQKLAAAEVRGGAIGAGPKQPAGAAVQISNGGAAQFPSRGGDLKGGDLNPLPGTQVEVEAVGRLLKTAGWQATEYTGGLALKGTVTQAQGPRVVHIATHGFFLSDEKLQASAQAEGRAANVNEDPMLRSGLFFAGADRVRQGNASEAGVDDGVLTAYEASQLNLQGTELVVLSACETGLGKELNVDGIFGLRRGLQEAGADSLLMSMWSVPDKETQELMALFYQKWLGGMEKPEALRQAQLEERETVKKRYGKDLPFYWGAFVLIGK